MKRIYNHGLVVAYLGDKKAMCIVFMQEIMPPPILRSSPLLEDNVVPMAALPLIEH